MYFFFFLFLCIKFCFDLVNFGAEYLLEKVNINWKKPGSNWVEVKFDFLCFYLQHLFSLFYFVTNNWLQDSRLALHFGKTEQYFKSGLFLLINDFFKLNFCCFKLLNIECHLNIAPFAMRITSLFVFFFLN